ncbi:MAG: CbiN domain protein [Bacteroidetes bacterium]|jgi:hypothetical protein|nr:CbiN domain protein [Bacteroidota bacterium]
MKRILLAAFYLISVFSSACECPPLEPLTKKISEQYDVIFYGKVDSVVPCKTDGIGRVYFTINSLYKGSAQQQVFVDYDCVSSCMMSFAKNDEWIIYSMFQHFDLLTVNICGHSRKKITDGSPDYYQAASQRSFEEEKNFLESTFGTQAFASHNKLNDDQKEMQPHNTQPGALNKLWLLLISLGVMVLIYFVTKKFFKNDK